MKRFIIASLLVMFILMGAGNAAFWDIGKIMEGKMPVPVGAPWIKDDQAMYFGDGKDASIVYNSTSGQAEVVGMAAVSNLSIAMESGEDITFAGGDSKMDLSAGSGIFKTPGGAITIGSGAISVTGTTTWASGKDIVAAGGASDIDFSLSSGVMKTPSGVFTVTNGGTVPTTKNWVITDADRLTVGGVIVPQEISLVVPISAASVDQYVFIADAAYNITGIREIHTVAGNDAGAVNVTVRVCDDTEAPSAGLNVITAVINLKATAATLQSGTLNASNVAVAANDMIALDFSGTLTNLAGGCVQIDLKRV